MVAQFDKETLARSVQFFSFNNSKEWAKSRKLDPSMGSEMINILYRTEAQVMEKTLTEQLEVLLAAGELQLIADLLPKAKSPLLKVVANILQYSSHTPLLNPLLERFRVADFAGRKAILSACERCADFSQLETLTQIENYLRSRKKMVKNDEDLARMASNIAGQIIEKDAILNVFKNMSPGKEALQGVTLEDLHPRLIQLPADEMLNWLQVMKDDTVLRESSRAYAMEYLAPPKSKSKTKLSKAVLRYNIALLAVMGAEGKDKILVNNLCKLDYMDQQALLVYVPEKIQTEVLKKLLRSLSTLEHGLWHIEQQPALIAIFKESLLKCFEQASISAKVRIGYLLLTAGQLPLARSLEYMKRMAIYLELSDHSTSRTQLFMELANNSGGYMAPALHRCKKRDLLLKELQKLSPTIAPIALKYSIEMYMPGMDELSDLLWLLEVWDHQDIYIQNKALREAMFRETVQHPQNLLPLLKAKRSNSSYQRIIASLINQLIFTTGEKFSSLAVDRLDQYSFKPELLFTDWQFRRGQLSEMLILYTQLGMADRDFYQSYQQVLEKNWDKNGSELKVQLHSVLSSLDNKGKTLLNRLLSYQDGISNRLKYSIDRFGKLADSLKISNFAPISQYLEDCQRAINEVLEKQFIELQEVCQLPSIDSDGPEQYHLSMEKLLLYREQLEVFVELEERVNYKLLSAFSLILERIFLTLKTSPIEVIKEMEVGLVQLLGEVNASIISSINTVVYFDPIIHKSNHPLNHGDIVQVIFPGIVMNDGTVVRHAMVERTDQEVMA